MARRIFEFRCEDGHITERYIGYETTIVDCEVCNKEATRIISMPQIVLDGSDPVFVSAHDKWARNHEQAAKIERKRNEA